ncbi:hypothetical protein [Streptomyces sp. NPDC054961]
MSITEVRRAGALAPARYGSDYALRSERAELGVEFGRVIHQATTATPTPT